MFPSTVIRGAHANDHAQVSSAIGQWWGGRDLSGLLQPLFLDHFSGTSFVAEDASGALVAFLVGFMSQDEPTVGYVHFVGVAPPQRGSGLGRGLYATFDEAIAGRGGQRVECVTSVVNTPSVAFHRAIGFTIDGYRDDPGVDGGRSVLMSRAIGREGLSGDGAVPVR